MTEGKSTILRVGEQTTPAAKMRLLADWFDAKYPNDSNPEVQNDLRAWARELDALTIALRRACHDGWADGD